MQDFRSGPDRRVVPINRISHSSIGFLNRRPGLHKQGMICISCDSAEASLLSLGVLNASRQRRNACHLSNVTGSANSRRPPVGGSLIAIRAHGNATNLECRRDLACPDSEASTGLADRLRCGKGPSTRSHRPWSQMGRSSEARPATAESSVTGSNTTPAEVTVWALDQPPRSISWD